GSSEVGSSDYAQRFQSESRVLLRQANDNRQ
ncbi:hypothetical protein, partial [Escherichia coli]